MTVWPGFIPPGSEKSKCLACHISEPCLQQWGTTVPCPLTTSPFTASEALKLCTFYSNINMNISPVMSFFSHNNLYSNSKKCNFIVGSPGWGLRKDRMRQTIMMKKQNEADEFKQHSHLLESTCFPDEIRKTLSSNCSPELLYFGCPPVPVSPSTSLLNLRKDFGP